MNMNDLTVNEYAIEVNLTGRHLIPEQITALLNCEPTCTVTPGENTHSCKHTMLKLEGFGLWAYETDAGDVAEGCCQSGLRTILNLIEPHYQQLTSIGVERIYLYYTLNSFTGLMNFKLSSDILKRIAALSADLYVSCFDCFNPSDPFWSEEQTEAEHK